MALIFTDHLDPISLAVGALGGSLIGAGIGYSIGYNSGYNQASSKAIDKNSNEVTKNLERIFGNYEMSNDGTFQQKKPMEDTRG